MLNKNLIVDFSLDESSPRKKKESFIIAQIDSVMEDSAVSKVDISFYTHKGVKMNLTYCDNKMYTIKSPIINENKLSVSTNEILTLSRKKLIDFSMINVNHIPKRKEVQLVMYR